MQQSVSDSVGSKSTTTVGGAISKIFKASGPLGFYAGAAPYVTLDALSGCIKFAAYEACNRCIVDVMMYVHVWAVGTIG